MGRPSGTCTWPRGWECSRPGYSHSRVCLEPPGGCPAGRAGPQAQGNVVKPGALSGACMATLLEVRDLKTYFFTQAGVVKAVDGVSYDLAEGETLGLVGESGCGKSVSALSIMRLVPDPPGKTVGGEVIFDGQDLLKLPDSH